MASDSPDSFTHPLSSPTPTPTPSPAYLADLAVRGSWRAILDEVARSRGAALSPSDRLSFLAFNALALAKLRRFSDAAAELDSLSDDLEPFALQWLRAVLPIKLGKRNDGLDRLYILLDLARARVRVSESQSTEELRVWKKREFFVTNSIISVHLSAKEFSVSLSLINDLIDRGFSDPILISKLGYIQMQIGDIDAAKRSFDRVEAAMEGREFGDLSEVQLANLIGRNKALVYLVAKDYVSAAREYDLCIERDNADAVAINNKALCLMYLRDLSDSIKALEGALERVPTAALDETLVMNLSSMYELAYVNHSDVKRTLSGWIARVAPDDFDSSCTRV